MLLCSHILRHALATSKTCESSRLTAGKVAFLKINLHFLKKMEKYTAVIYTVLVTNFVVDPKSIGGVF
jgi:hypothetical protein